MKGFGVGCWSFEPVPDLSGKDSLDDIFMNSRNYVETIRTSLSKISTISNLELSPEFDLQPPFFEEDEGMEDDGNNLVLSRTEFFPRISGGWIKFDIQIPAHIQYSFYGIPFAIGENFRVLMKFTVDFPVAFITCQDSDVQIMRPSHCMVVVREYLRSELKLQNSPINLRVLGPSPFHADFFLQTSPEDSMWNAKNRLNIDVVKHPSSYSDIYCYWSPHEFTNESEALEYCFSNLLPELSKYYSIIARKNYRDNRSDKVDELLKKLVNYYRSDSFKNRFYRFFRAGKMSRSLILEVRLIQLLANEQKLEFSNELRSLYSDDFPGFLKDFIQGQIDEISIGEDLGTENLAKLFESRRTSEMNLLILVVASILGGVVGAVLNGLLAK